MICCGSPQKEQLKAEEEEDHDSDSQTVCAGVVVRATSRV